MPGHNANALLFDYHVRTVVMAVDETSTVNVKLLPKSDELLRLGNPEYLSKQG